MRSGGGCEAAVTARTRCWWVRFGECGWLVHGKRFLIRLVDAVYKSYVKPVNICRSEAWCLMESKMGILQRID